MPDEVGDCHLPVKKYIGVMRFTRTNLDTSPGKEIEDIWCDRGPVEMVSNSIGSTTFDILRPKPRHGYTWVEGRETKLQTTTRPGDIRSEAWTGMLKKQKKKGIDDWDIQGNPETKQESEEDYITCQMKTKTIAKLGQMLEQNVHHLHSQLCVWATTELHSYATGDLVQKDRTRTT